MSRADWNDSGNPWGDDSPDETPSVSERWKQWHYSDEDQAVEYVTPTTMPHSGFGIASVVLTVFAGIVGAGSIVVATIVSLNNPAIREDDPQLISAGCGILGSMVLAFLGGLLGVAGLFQRDRNRQLAVLGCVFAIAILGSAAALITIGLLFG